MDPEKEACLVVDGALVVGDARAVGGAYLAQDCVGLGHHVGDTKRPADLNQLAA